MMNTNVKQLEVQIERLVREHLAACERAASEAVARAFESVGGGRSSRGRREVSRKTTKPRRSAEELAALGERLFTAVWAKPGESMREFAADVGATCGELQRPMDRLKQTGRVRSAGQRQFTRYFPMADRVDTAA